ncbi:MAG: LysR family transcriptional regulator [Rhodospirillales bacterium]|nr:LysR family transcriptional regulator [Rhodospirillales bacterium]
MNWPMNWEDLRYFLAVARAGSLSGAARSLGVNHSTVFRRIQGFEDKLGVRLFDRLASGYALTVEGNDLAAAAERIDTEIDASMRRLTGRDLSLSGTLRITTTETLMHWMLAPHIAAFKAEYPGIDLELALATDFFNLTKRQADIAIRPTLEPPENLIGRKISGIAFAPYAATAYLGIQGKKKLDALTWVAFDDNLSHLAAAQWMRDALAGVSIGLRVNTLSAMFAAAKAGMGAAVLPCFMGDQEKGLKRLRPPAPEMASALWLLTHEDLRLTARVRAFMDFMGRALKGERKVLEGKKAA